MQDTRNTRFTVVGAAIVASLLILVGCTPQTPPPPAPSPTVTKQDVDITVLVTKKGADGVTKGATSDVTVSVEPGTAGEFKLASVESDVRGTGDQWKASEWAGSAAALMMTGFNPAAVKASYDVSGLIDGPSAGAIMTVAMAAALNGHSLNPGISMTGTINPDGTIGPVGGIPHKIDGAKEAGLKTVVIPSGTAISQDANTGEAVDVIAYGQQIGVNVFEAADVEAAYKIFTGEELSAGPPPVTQYSLSEAATATMDNKTDSWLVIYQQTAEENAAQHSQAAAQFGVDHYADLAAENARLAQQYQQQGAAAAAYDAATFAAYLEFQVNQLGRAVTATRKNGAAGLQQFLDDSATIRTESGQVLDQFLAITPADVSDVGWLTGAYSFLLDGLARSLSTQELLDEQTTDEQALKNIQTVIERNAQTEILTAMAQDMLDIGTDESGAPIDTGDTEAYAKFFSDAADANLALFESTVIATSADEAGISEAKARINFAERQPDYENILLSDNVIRILEDQGGSGTSLEFAKLGAALNRYVTSAQLIATFYSLEAEVDPETFAVTNLPLTKQVQAMLEASEDQVLRGVALLEQNQVDPTPVTMLYEMALYETNEAIETSDSWLLLTGMSSMWQAQLLTSIMATYGGFARNPAG